VVCLLLLVQAGATGIRQAAAPTPAPVASCQTTFRVGFVTDVAGTQSSVDIEGWRGVTQALRDLPCARAERIVPGRPSEYRRNLQAAVDHHDDLVIAGSFLLTAAVVDAARSNPATHFLLVDPIVVPAELPNLSALSFREDQAAFLAGALAGMVTRTGIVAGVYGPGGAADQANRSGFEHGAQYVRPGLRILGAYQPASEGAPYANTAWGAAEARVFLGQGADIIFGAGGTTGVGALLATAQAARLCIGADTDSADDPAVAACLLGTTVRFIDLGVKLAVADAAASGWTAGVHSLGIAQGGVGLRSTSNAGLTPEVQQRLQLIARLLADGALTTHA